MQKNKDDPRSHTNQHEPKYFRLEVDVTFEAKLDEVRSQKSEVRGQKSLSLCVLCGSYDL
jgi:hypothetical protein